MRDVQAEVHLSCITALLPSSSHSLSRRIPDFGAALLHQLAGLDKRRWLSLLVKCWPQHGLGSERVSLMAYGRILVLAVKRAWNHRLLTSLSIWGVALAVALIGSIPIFTESVGMHIVRQELAEDAYGNTSPPLAFRYYRVPSAPEPMTMQQALDLGTWLGQLTSREMGLPVARTHVQIGSHAFMIRPLSGDTRYQERGLRLVRVNCVPGIERQIEIVEGIPFSEADTADTLLVWARPSLLDELGIQVGEEFDLFNHNALHPDRPLRFRMGGAWQAKDPNGPFWYTDPHQLLELEFLTSLGAFTRFVAPVMPQQLDFSFWYYVLDEGRIRLDRVEAYARGARIAQAKAEGMLPSIRVDRSPIKPLREAQHRAVVLERLLLGFNLPVIVLLLVFLAAMSAVSLRFQRGELAILVSRGTSRVQLLGINAAEALLHISMGAPLGLLMARGFARAMSLCAGFMTFDRQVSLPLVAGGHDWRLTGLTLGFSLLARLLPTFRAGRSTIIMHGRARARPTRPNRTAWILFTVILSVASGYAYHQMRSRETLGLVSWQPGGEAVNDPLLFLAPTLFMVTLALIASSLFPAFMRILDLIAGLLGPSLYLGVRSLSRQSAWYTTSLFLLILCLCLGTFEASIARSADSWLLDRCTTKWVPTIASLSAPGPPLDQWSPSASTAG